MLAAERKAVMMSETFKKQIGGSNFNSQGTVEIGNQSTTPIQSISKAEKVLDEASSYVTGFGVEASLAESASRIGLGAAKDIGPKMLNGLSKFSTGVSGAGVFISGFQAINDFKRGDTKNGLLHTADAGVNATLITITAICPAAAPVTAVIGAIYNFWSIIR